MEDKVLECCNKLAETTSDGFENVAKALLTQAKINKRQKKINFALGTIIVACLCNISDLHKDIKAQNKKIEKLEKKSKTDKGE